MNRLPCDISNEMTPIKEMTTVSFSRVENKAGTWQRVHYTVRVGRKVSEDIFTVLSKHGWKEKSK